MIRNCYFEILLIMFLFFEKGYSNQNGNIDFAKLKYKELYALRTNHPPTIDGVLDDKVWAQKSVKELNGPISCSGDTAAAS